MAREVVAAEAEKRDVTGETELAKVRQDLEHGLASLKVAAEGCRDNVQVAKEYGPTLEVTDGFYTGFDATRPAPRQGSDPHVSKARQNVMAMAKSLEDRLYRHLDSAEPPKADLVAGRYGMVQLTQTCQKCRALESEQNPPPCGALEILARLQRHGESAAKAS